VASAIGFQAVRVTDPDRLDEAVRSAFAHTGPALIDVVTNPEEVSLPKVKVGQAWGFSIAKLTETLESRGG
jgi:pyruvate dehydrogenase (quinone)